MRARNRAVALLLVAMLAAAGWYFWQAKGHEVVMAPVEGVFGISDRVDAAAGARSEGCGKAEPAPMGRAFETPKGRSFYVWGPPKLDARAYPIVLAFHGWGSNGRGFQKWFEMEKYVDGAALVVYPDAEGSNWDYGYQRDLDFVADIIGIMKRTWCVDETRVLALGFSYGSRFVNHLGCKRPDLVRAIVPSGGRWDAIEKDCVRPMPVLVAHRTNDPTMPVADGREAAQRWAKIDGCGDTQPVAHGCIAWKDCKAGAVTFCEDPHFDEEWPAGWNHTMREEYRLLAWRWFAALP